MRELLYQALSSPRGIAVEVDAPQRLIQKLHTERRNAKDPALGCLTIAVSRTNPEGEVWIVKQEKGAESNAA